MQPIYAEQPDRKIMGKSDFNDLVRYSACAMKGWRT